MTRSLPKAIHLLVTLSLIFNLNSMRAMAEDEPPATELSEEARLAASPWKWDRNGSTLWAMYGIKVGQLIDKVQDAKNALNRIYPKDSADGILIREVWGLLKEDSFKELYAAFIKALGAKNLASGSGELHCRLFHAFFRSNEGDEAAVFWTLSEKLEHLAEFLESSAEFKNVYPKNVLEQIRVQSRKHRQHAGFTSEWGEYYRKAKPFILVGCAAMIYIAGYKKGAHDFAPAPESNIMQMHDPLPATTDVRRPDPLETYQRDADEAARIRGEDLDFSH